MKALDLFCGAGGAAQGLKRAGFDFVLGMDIVPQPRYSGHRFIQCDVLDMQARGAALDGWHSGMADFDLIWASPPCQAYSDLAKRNGNGHEWPKLIERVRALLKATHTAYVIENVEGAPLLDPVRLCGTQFPPLRVLRHRLFEANFKIDDLPHGKHPKVHTFDKRKSHFGKTNGWDDFVQVTGGGNSTLAQASDAMGIGWMTKAEINEAIPPAYAEHIGRCFLDARLSPAVAQSMARFWKRIDEVDSQSAKA